MISVLPSTAHGTRPVVAIVVKPVPRHDPLARGCVIADEHGGLHRVTADVVYAIDFYPANPVNHQSKGQP